MVYYTAKFRNSFPNVEEMNTYIDLVFLEANQGYENSNVPILLVMHCKELISIRDYDSLSAGEALANFAQDVGTQSADTADRSHGVELKPKTACDRQLKLHTIYFKNSSSQLFILFCLGLPRCFCSSFGESDYDAEWMKLHSIHLCRYQK